MRIALPFLFALSLVATAAATTAAPEPSAGARTTMDATVNAVLDALADESIPFEARRERIVDIAYARFDFETMAKLVLKRDWRKFSDAERTHFVESFGFDHRKSYIPVQDGIMRQINLLLAAFSEELRNGITTTRE